MTISPNINFVEQRMVPAITTTKRAANIDFGIFSQMLPETSKTKSLFLHKLKALGWLQLFKHSTLFYSMAPLEMKRT